MKLIIDQKNDRNVSFHIFNTFRNILIVLSYIIGFSLYALIFLVWNIDWKHINLGWIAVPSIGFALGIAHMFFIYKGSLFCKALIMFTIMFYTFFLPIIIAFIN